MNKLKHKVFWVIFSLLTIFTFIIITTSMTRTYIERKHAISNILTKMPRNFERIEKNPDFTKEEKVPDNPRKIYLDFTVYTIILDENGNTVSKFEIKTEEYNINVRYFIGNDGETLLYAGHMFNDTISQQACIIRIKDNEISLIPYEENANNNIVSDNREVKSYVDGFYYGHTYGVNGEDLVFKLDLEGTIIWEKSIAKYVNDDAYIEDFIVNNNFIYLIVYDGLCGGAYSIFKFDIECFFLQKNWL